MIPHPPFSNPTTSHGAAHEIAASAASIRERVYRLIAADWMAADGSILFVGATCDEVEQELELRHQTTSARIRELAQSGRIVAGGRRKTRSGRLAIVWCVPVPKPKQLELV